MAWWPLFFVASMFVSGVSRAVKDKQRLINVDDIRYPSASEHAPIPVAFGRVWLDHPNVLWFGDATIDRTYATTPGVPGSGGDSTGYGGGTTINYSMRLGLHIGLCHSGVYRIDGIKYAGKELSFSHWEAGTAFFTYVDEQAGLDWYVSVNEGRRAVDDRTYYSANGGPYDGMTALPQHVGALTLWFQSSDEIAEPGVSKGAKWSSGETNLEPLAFQVIRRPCDAYAEHTWEAALAYTDLIGAGPAHCLYELLTSTQYGLGFSTASIDTTSFAAAATTLKAEGIGLNFVMEDADEKRAGEVIRDILGIIDGVLYVGQDDGLFHLDLLRDDYVVGDLTTISPANCQSLSEVSRPSLSEIANEITATCYDFGGAKKSLTVQDLAAVQSIGTVISQSLDLSMVGSLTAANAIATRELKKLGLCLYTATATVDRAAAYGLEIGSCVKVTWAKYGFATVVFRVLGIEYGELADGAVTLTLQQDAYGLPDSIYSDPGDSTWVDPVNDPADVTDYLLAEAPYHLAHKANPSLAIQIDGGYAGTQIGLQTVCAARPTADTSKFDVAAEIQTITGNYRIDGGALITPWIDITGTIGQSDTLLAYSTADGLLGLDVGTSGILGLLTGETVVDAALPVDHWDAEVVLVTDLGIGTGIVTVKRGYLDTTAWPHGAGSRLWLIQRDCGDYAGVQAVLRTPCYKQIEYDWKILPSTSRGRLALDDSTAIPWAANTFQQRFFRPYPPGKLCLNGTEFPTTVSGDVVLTWEHRNKSDQLLSAYMADQAETGLTAPTDCEYVLLVAGDGGFTAGYSTIVIDDLLDTYTWTEAAEIAAFGALQSDLYFALYMRPTATPLLYSWRPQYRHVQRTSFGFGFGYDFGGA